MAKGKMTAAPEGVNKMQLVRDAMAALGDDPKPLDIQAHIKSTSGFDMPTGIISSYKSMIRGKQGMRVSRGAGGVKIEDIEQVQAMIKKMGADNLVKLVSTLSGK